MFDKVFEL